MGGMSDLYVDTAGLRVVEGALGRVAGDLRACATTLMTATAAGLGDDELEAACVDFVDSWSYGTSQLAVAASTVREVLAEGLRVYAQIEAELASVATA